MNWNNNKGDKKGKCFLMRYDRNYAYFRPHFDWYTFKVGVGYVPTEKAPPEAIEAMKKYNSYIYNTDKRKNTKIKATDKREDQEDLGDIIKPNNELDNYGRLTDSMPSKMLGYDFYSICKYCIENGKQLSELTYKEIEQFRHTI